MSAYIPSTKPYKTKTYRVLWNSIWDLREINQPWLLQRGYPQPWSPKHQNLCCFRSAWGLQQPKKVLEVAAPILGWVPV